MIESNEEAWAMDLNKREDLEGFINELDSVFIKYKSKISGEMLMGLLEKYKLNRLNNH